MTLIELLSSFAILAIIVSLLAITLNTATDTWRSAQARTRTVAQARAVLDTIAQDLRQAVTNQVFPITLGDATSSYGSTNNWIQFMRIGPPLGGETNAFWVRAVRYGVATNNGTFQLACWTQSLAVTTSGRLPGTWDDDNLPFNTQTPLILADGLAALRFSPADTNNAVLAGVTSLPYFDIYLELLGANDCDAARNLSDANRTPFVERHVLRFSQRVFLPAVNRWNLP